ncbi:S26 family signal peptidase [Nannocystis pusilla]|uniref:S26 family signal peptidase n=1 Tax=Nannocystis pusilla TaxID=889268 RepID=A0ABS7TUA8_9BACT|nr:S26 family signal peptidase [Nannocystis pusilla]MBZ5711832.1 S26 family signal peptidase [Nannocystis pusilla]
MFFRRQPEPDDYASPPDRTWPTRLAWCVLVGGAALLVLRCSFATVVEIHGDGMAPNLRSGDHVLFVRGTWGLDRGDLVVYDPTPPPPPPAPEPVQELPGARPEPDARPRVSGTRDRLRNTAVVDAKELGLDDEWEKVQRRSGVAGRPPPRSLRVARILALPGDTVTFGDPRGALGLAINGEPLAHKPGDGPGEAGARPTSFEIIDDRRYQVLASTAGPDAWPGMGVPADGGPYEMPADGYLLVADNRDEGACCDSRAIGWVDTDQLRGEIVLRLGGAPDDPPAAKP